MARFKINVIVAARTSRCKDSAYVRHPRSMAKAVSRTRFQAFPCNVVDESAQSNFVLRTGQVRDTADIVSTSVTRLLNGRDLESLMQASSISDSSVRNKLSCICGCRSQHGRNRCPAIDLQQR
jgi:hypothetical protein